MERALYSQPKIRQGADCGSHHELLIAKFRLKLKKVGKTTRHFSSVLFTYKVNHSISKLSKSMPQPVTLKKLKLNGFMKTYKTF